MNGLNIYILHGCIALIPARGGSKVFPEKILSLQFKPLIYWSIKIALESNKVDRVIVLLKMKKLLILRGPSAEVIL